MKLLRTVATILILLLISAAILVKNRDWKAEVAVRRPTTDYKNYEQIINDYCGEVQRGYGCDFKFVRSIVSLAKQKCDDSAYAGWKKTEAPDTESPYTYEKDDVLFGCSAHFNVGVNAQTGRHVAAFITLTDPEGSEGNVYKVFQELWAANMDGVGVADSYYLDREASDQDTVTRLVETGVSDRDIAIVWPKGAMAWMVMVDYRFEDGKQMLEIRVL